MKMRGLAVAVLIFSLLPLVSCSSGGGGGQESSSSDESSSDSNGQGVFNTTWALYVYENNYLVDSGYLRVDAEGNLSGEVGDGAISGEVNADGSGAGWTRGGSSGSGSLRQDGSGSGTWRSDDGYSGSWTATRL